MSSIPISKEGFQALEQELDRLKKERPHVIQAIKEAREEGDLKENAGYDAARERQGMLEAPSSSAANCRAAVRSIMNWT